jgi:hypothetical protein
MHILFLTEAQILGPAEKENGEENRTSLDQALHAALHTALHTAES